MGLMKEFKEFAVKGNALDMAVGIIIGAAFGKIVSSLVNDVIMPPIENFWETLIFPACLSIWGPQLKTWLRPRRPVRRP